MKKTKYVVLSDKENLSLGWEESIIAGLGICHTFSKAYEIALFLSGITEPEIKYRKALETIKQKGAIQIRSSRDGEAGAVIARVKIY
jgi:hypothetical protein